MRKRVSWQQSLLGLALLALQAPPAAAVSSYVGTWSNIYPASTSDSNAGCALCHASSSNFGFNPYGAAIAGSNAGSISARIQAVESLNSDNDAGGASNLVEINANAQPGWTGSAPAGVSGDLDPAPANTAPVAVAGGPYSGVAGETLVQFDGSGSSDPDGDTLTYAWDFGDGDTATGMMPTHTYATAGTFTVTLVVNDGQVDSDPAEASASITAPPVNRAPTADPGGPYSGEPGAPVSFDGSGSSDPNDDALAYAWDFGDGATASVMSPTHTYAAAGVYTVSLTVNDGQLDSAAATTTATIETPPANRAPTADAGGPYSGDAGAAIDFDGSGSSDPDGDTLTYAWDFGDGNSGTGPTPSHVYATAGQYTVSLVVSDGTLASPASSTTATVTDPGERSDGEALYADYCAGCHGADPWAAPAVDEALFGVRRVAGSRDCNLEGSIFGTSVFPNGAPGMEFLQSILSEADIAELADYLNSQETTGEQRYVSTCAGCHGNDGSGGRTGEDVQGDSAGETLEAISEEREMRYLSCMPRSDIDAIAAYLRQSDSDPGDDRDDDGDDDENGGGCTIGSRSAIDPTLPALLGVLGLGYALRRRREAGARAS